jgi:peptidoglycan/xylan/chitin deacetylase (PgdA/CDA1 family)
VLLNPLVISSVVVAIVAAGWLAYAGGTSSVAQARPGANLFPTLEAATEPAGSVGGWQVSHSGDAATSLNLVDGEQNAHALKLDVARYASGDVTLTSPLVEIRPGTTYLFKTFVTSDADFTLLTRQHHADGSTTLEQEENPLERPGNSLFTVGDAFVSGVTTTAVEYVFRLTSTGTVRVEGAYLEAAEDVKVPPVAATAPNLIPDPGLSDTQAGQPGPWSPYSSGESTVAFERGNDNDGGFLRTSISNYRSGEAKWQYPPVPVTADQYFTFGATYQSDRVVDVVAEFELANGGRVFHTLATVSPAGEWTTITEFFQVPDGAKSAMVTLVSHGDGTTGVRNCSLTDVTRPGALRWDHPKVSITFDDGWQSVYDRALPLLDKHDFRSTHYVNASSIETPNFMTAAELQRMHEAGHEIAAHSYDHVDLTSLGTDRLDDELRSSSAALAAAGLGTDSLAPPYGRSDPQVDWYASRYFDLVRGTEQGINTRQNLEAHDLKVFYVTDETTSDDLTEALAETSRLNGWLILVYHQIATPEDSGTQQNTITADRSTITSDALAGQLQLIDKSGIDVQPVAQAFEQLQGPQ